MARIFMATLMVLALASCSASGGASPSVTESPAPTATSVEPAPSASEEPSEPSPSAEQSGEHPATGLALTRFLGDDNPISQIFVVEADGSLRQVTGLSGALGASQAAWSPDGTQIAFNDPLTGTPGIFGQIAVVNADGTGERKLAEGGAQQWSPDGSRIVFGEVDPVGNEEPSMFLVDVATGEVTDLGFGFGPRWLPDGERISFGRAVTLSGGAMTTALYVMPVDGGEALEIAEETTAYWSPDGSAVLLEHDGVLSVAAPDFSGARKLVDGFAPVWSPDGQRVVFAYDHDQDANPVLALVDLDGRTVWSGAVGSAPTWSPDGSRIAVEVYAEESPVVHVIDASSGDALWEIEGSQPAWGPG